MSGLIYYAGIGSRETPGPVQSYMTTTAGRLSKIGYILRSGGAKGADKAFEEGANGVAVILRPEHATVEAIGEAARAHPAWGARRSYTQKLHGRNVMIVLGEDKLDDKDKWVKFVICWTPPDIPRGGTKLGMRVALDRGITVFNLAVPGEKEKLESLLERLEAESS